MLLRRPFTSWETKLRKRTRKGQGPEYIIWDMALMAQILQLSPIPCFPHPALTIHNLNTPPMKTEPSEFHHFQKLTTTPRCPSLWRRFHIPPMAHPKFMWDPLILQKGVLAYPVYLCIKLLILTFLKMTFYHYAMKIQWRNEERRRLGHNLVKK